MQLMGYGEGGANDYRAIVTGEHLEALASCAMTPDCWEGVYDRAQDVVQAMTTYQLMVDGEAGWSGNTPMLGVTPDATVVGLLSAHYSGPDPFNENSAWGVLFAQGPDSEYPVQFGLDQGPSFKDGGTRTYEFVDAGIDTTLVLPPHAEWGLASLPAGAGSDISQPVFPLEVLGIDSGTTYGEFNPENHGRDNHDALALFYGEDTTLKPIEWPSATLAQTVRYEDLDY